MQHEWFRASLVTLLPYVTTCETARCARQLEADHAQTHEFPLRRVEARDEFVDSGVVPLGCKVFVSWGLQTL